MLVTGLPVSQYMDVERREALKSRLEGEHQITPKRSVAVKSLWLYLNLPVLTWML